MSRINDALKQAQQSQAGQPPGGLPPLTPATRKAAGIGWFIPTLVFLLLIGAGIFIGLALFQQAPVSASPAPVLRPSEVSVSPPKVFKPAPVMVVVATNALAATNTAVVVAKPVLPAPLKLQGIGADPSRPWAIVSGKTVFVGDLVDDFRVAAISQKAVTLTKPDGSSKILSLAE